MQKDFHFYCVGVLARAAGFGSQDALTIAYASQYVDDATESEPIPVQTEQGELKFDPVRTSYTALQQLKSLEWSAQKRVWIPFHFIPPQPFSAQKSKPFSFVTQAGSPFAQQLLDWAADGLPANRKYRLCRIGIALHTYADTWAHQGFSGRQSRVENDIGNLRIHHRDTGKEGHLGIENIIFDALPEIGHAEALYLADLAYQKWSYRRTVSKEDIERDNTAQFLLAARAIYDWLRTIKANETGESAFKTWDEIEAQIAELLAEEPKSEPDFLQKITLPAYRAYCAMDVEQRCKKWRSVFANLFGSMARHYNYDPKKWRGKAVEGDVDWDDYTPEDWQRMSPRKAKRGFWNSSWVHFHRAALRQRHFVLERLP